METYFIQIRYAQHFQDYYIDAGCLEDAAEEARSKYAIENNIPKGNYGFINAVA